MRFLSTFTTRLNGQRAFPELMLSFALAAMIYASIAGF